MLKRRKYLLGFLIFANITLVVYVIASWQSPKPTTSKLISNELLSNDFIKHRMKLLATDSKKNQAVLALFSSTSTSCATGLIAEMFKKTASQNSNSNLHIVLPSSYSEQDISNFKSNLDVNFEVSRADSQLSEFWRPIANKYNAAGIVIVAKNDLIYTSQDTQDIQTYLEQLD